MLKLTYTSTGVSLERSVESLEAAMRRRVLLSLSMGAPLGLEPTSISLMVDRSLPKLKVLMRAISEAPAPALKLIHKEAAQVEMQLQGYWLSQQEPEQGVFMTNLDSGLEGHLVDVWRASQQDVSCFS